MGASAFCIPGATPCDYSVTIGYGCLDHTLIRDSDSPASRQSPCSLIIEKTELAIPLKAFSSSSIMPSPLES